MKRVAPSPELSARLQSRDGVVEPFVRSRWVGLLLFLMTALGLPQVTRAAASDPDIKPEEAAYALLERVIPGRANDFFFEQIPASDGMDVFEVQSIGGKVHIRGNNGVAMASGLNWYLETQCQCQVSLAGTQLKLPSPLPMVDTKVRQVASVRYRNFFNYCSFAYTMAWWDWAQWERLIDYMALHGVNLPLAMVGQEAVWQKVYRDLGLTDKQIGEFIAGPAYLPWGWMGNVDGLGGPMPQSWIDGHRELQQKILQRERSLGMTPILQGFTGHVPKSIKDVFPKATIHQTTDWAGMPGTYFLDPSDPLFQDIGTRFIRAQTEMFGTDHLYDADCFNEVNPHTNDTNYLAEVGASVYRAMSAADPKAIWVFQGWFLFWQRDFWKPPQARALVSTVPDENMIGLDLYCERNPVWDKTEAFYGKPWIWNVICNLGQKVNLSGDLKVMQDNFHHAMTSPDAGKLSGLGVMMEGFGYNPIVQDFVLSKTWQPENVDLTRWVKQYAKRRYGTSNKSAQQAWVHLLNGPYAHNITSGSLLNYTPGLSKYDPKENLFGAEYDVTQTVKACEALLACADELSAVDSYRFDLVHVCREMLVGAARPIVRDLKLAYDAKDRAKFDAGAKQLLELLRDLDALLATRPEFRLNTWLNDAQSWATTDSERALYELNARALVTMWQPSVDSQLRDYASRDWSGLYGSFYLKRWQMYLDDLSAAWDADEDFDRPAFMKSLKEFELTWINSREPIAEPKSGDSVAIAKALFAKYKSIFATGTESAVAPNTVRFVYLVSADREVKPEYVAGIERAAKEMQVWYGKQLNGLTFKLADPIVEVIKSDKNAAWFNTHTNGNYVPDWGYLNTRDEMKRLRGVKPGEDHYTWVVYSDGQGDNGRASTGFAYMPEDDLLGLVGRHPTQKSINRWIAGMGHELGHAFSLPHPEDTKKHNDALMWAGFYNQYPDGRCYLTDEDKATLLASPFFKKWDSDAKAEAASAKLD